MTTNNRDEEGGLSEERKRALDRMIERLVDYIHKNPVEFNERLERLRAINNRIKSRLHAEALLSLNEKELKAFNFIRSELQKGRSPELPPKIRTTG